MKNDLGFYRVNYDFDNWRLIFNFLNSHRREEIHVMNRLQLMLDVNKFYRICLIDLSAVLTLLDGLIYESDYSVLRYGFERLNWLNDLLIDTDYYPNFKVRNS